MQNVLPSRRKSASPLFLAFKKKENFKNLATFGCRVWVRPPRLNNRRKKGKLHADSRKGIFLGYKIGTTRNIKWFDPETNRVKSASNFRFDEMYNDLPVNKRPPNIIQLERCQGESGLPPIEENDDASWISSSDLEIFTTPFPDTFTKTIKISEDQPTSRPNCFGFIFDTDGLNQRVFVSEILNKSDASSLLTSKTQRANILGAYIVAINESPIFTRKEAIDKLVSLHQDGASSFTITFGKQKQLTSKEFSQALLDLEL